MKQPDNSINHVTKEAPYNSEAEQAILGNFLINNDHINKVSDILISEHFYVPLHRKNIRGYSKVSRKGNGCKSYNFEKLL